LKSERFLLNAENLRESNVLK